MIDCLSLLQSRFPNHRTIRFVPEGHFTVGSKRPHPSSKSASLDGDEPVFRRYQPHLLSFTNGKYVPRRYSTRPVSIDHEVDPRFDVPLAIYPSDECHTDILLSGDVERNPGPPRSGPMRRRNTKRKPQSQEARLRRMGHNNSESSRPIPPISNDRTNLIVTRRYDAGTITASTLADSFTQFTVSLNTLPSYAEFTTLFDQYRILRLSLTFHPLQNEAVNATTAATPGIFTVVDYDDSTTLASLTQTLQYANAHWHDGYRPFTVTFKPHIAVASYAGSFNGYTNLKDQWIDSSSFNVIHYGLKVCMLQCTGAAQSWRVFGNLLFELKNVR